eukprot:jgi/Ulvmu1/6617/UM003_0254.1
MADDDLYGDLPDIAAGIEEDVPAAIAAEPVSQAPEPAAEDPPQEERPDEAVALAAETAAVKAEEDIPEDVSVESAFAQIAEAVGLKDAAPREVLAGFSDMTAKAQQQSVQTIQDRSRRIADQVQIANLATEVLELRRRLADSVVATQPAAIHLTSMHCDPAIAREFEYLKSENAKLIQSNSQLRGNLAGAQFKPSDDKGRKLVDKLHAAQDEARALEAQLQARDESLAQVALSTQHAAELHSTCTRLQAHVQQLEATVADLVTSAATMAKTDGRHGAWQQRSGAGGLGADGGGGGAHGDGYAAAVFRGQREARPGGERTRRGARNREGRNGGKRPAYNDGGGGGGGRRRV